MDEAHGLLRLGTRGSALARWQTEHVAALLAATWPALKCETIEFHTQGDRMLDTPLPVLGGKGVFTAELEAALHSGDIDLAVHSLKDLPTEMPYGLALGAVPVRAEVADVLVTRTGCKLDALPPGAVIGTSSRRRAAQLLYHRPDLRMLDVRGNVGTRVSKGLAADGPYDAVVLAHAGISRLGLTDVITEVLGAEVMLPAAGQAEAVAQTELDLMLRRLDGADAHTREVMALLAHRIVGKLLHEPTVRLKSVAAHGNGDAYANVLSTLFALDVAEQAPCTKTDGDTHDG